MLLNQSKLKALGEALAAVVPNTYHYWRPRLQPPFCVWAEDSGNAFCGNNRVAEQAIHGTVDYFTLEEYDQTVERIQEALNTQPIGWALNSVQFEEETNLIHWEWSWEM
ncbi:MAG TPA: hypothetical protein IAC31_09195 [Candidatus Faecousia intestinigallinarum]|nr:hypothetical protein [Candidatus Faecousia intestinigallinarum]